MKVRITKINVNTESVAEQAQTIQEYRDSLEDIFDCKSPPIDYYVEGTIANGSFAIGKPIIMHRTNRNGVSAIGIFMSTPLVSIREAQDTALIVTTLNSVYKIEKIET